MKTTELQMGDITISNSIKKSMTYDAYLDLVNDLVEQKSTTGHEKTEALANYTMLNQRRMKRWDKSIKLSDADLTKIREFQRPVTWLVLTESWCGDAAHILPVIHKVAEQNDKINFKVVLRDEHPELMNAFLTNGGRAIPKLIMIDDNTQEVLNTFGPRPSVATEAVNAYKAKYGTLSAEFKEDLQRWYNKDKGKSIIEDLVKLLD